MARILEVKPIHRGWSSFSLVGVETDGGARVDRYVEDHGSAAAVLAYDPDRKAALLVRQLRAPVLMAGEGEFPEPIAGLIDPGEDAVTAARREAMEETGLRLGSLESLGRFWSSPGVTTERTGLFLAAYSAADRDGEGGGTDEHEDIEVIELPLAELARRADLGELQDLKLYAMVQALRLKRPELFD